MTKPKGPRQGKVTPEQAASMREVYMRPDGGASVTTLASRYGVSVTLVQAILRGTHATTRGMDNISGKRRYSWARPMGERG